MEQDRDEDSYRWRSRFRSFFRWLWQGIASIFQHFVCCSNNNRNRHLPSRDTPRPRPDGRQKPEAHLLVIGASDTGKSTFMRQMRLDFGDQYPVSERRCHQSHIRRNVLESIHKLVTAASVYNLSYATTNNEDAAKTFLEWSSLEVFIEESDIDSSLAESIETLWEDPAIQEAYRRRSEFHLMTNADYFITNAARILEQDYLPSIDDILRMRVVTQGAVTKTFELPTINMTLHDMGGQRPDRRNWVQQLDNPATILFLASLSEYDQTVEEAAEENKNRVQESLDIFEALMGYLPFENTPVILLLNKSDIFSIKIQEQPLKKFFPDYKGPEGDELKGRDYITSLYEELTTRYNRNLLVRYTEATNRENFRAIFSFLNNYVSRTVIGIGGLY